MALLDSFPEDWRQAMEPYLKWCPLEKLEAFVEGEYASQTVYPPRHQLFRAYYATPFEDVKVLILGQDPYHEEGQACGLAFAVPQNVKWPASLRNIAKEYADDLGTPMPLDADFGILGNRGVMLLNTVLTVRAGQAASHQGHGWEEFTDATIRCLSAREKPLVFLLWGRPAVQKERLIDLRRHRVIKSAHPSPLSAYRGFFGSRPFSAVNAALESVGCSPVDWRLE
ncbi:MAG: uracil-DNA glycosylase [Victivallales bacterium]|nr:uracil-DNA glycosylase [Victivallales bacterium]